MGIITYPGEMFDSSTVFLDVLSTGIAKEPCRAGSFICTERCTLDFFYKIRERL